MQKKKKIPRKKKIPQTKTKNSHQKKNSTNTVGTLIVPATSICKCGCVTVCSSSTAGQLWNTRTQRSPPHASARQEPPTLSVSPSSSRSCTAVRSTCAVAEPVWGGKDFFLIYSQTNFFFYGQILSQNFFKYIIVKFFYSVKVSQLHCRQVNLHCGRASLVGDIALHFTFI